jgi:hypothetical protein
VAAAGAGATLTINFIREFTLTSSLAQLSAGAGNVTVNITGNGQTINGAGSFQGIWLRQLQRTEHQSTKRRQRADQLLQHQQRHSGTVRRAHLQRGALGSPLSANFLGQNHGARVEGGYRVGVARTVGITPYGAALRVARARAADDARPGNAIH